MMRGLNVWLAGRSERERILLGILAGLIVLVMIYGVIWLPLRFWEHSAQQRLRDARAQQADLNWLRTHQVQGAAVAGEFANLPSGPELALLAGREPLQTRLSRSAAALGLEVKQIQAGEGGVITMELAHIRGAVLLNWLKRVEAQGRIVILRAGLEPETDGSGGLHAQIQLSERRL